MAVMNMQPVGTLTASKLKKWE